MNNDKKIITNPKLIDVIRDVSLDKMFEEIIEIFKLEGVELVRLSGMTNWCRKTSGKNDIPHQAVDSVIRKMRSNNVIEFDYITKCQHCGETSYIVKPKEDFLRKPKMCDSCNTFFALIEGSSLEIIKRDL